MNKVRYKSQHSKIRVVELLNYIEESTLRYIRRKSKFYHQVMSVFSRRILVENVPDSYSG